MNAVSSKIAEGGTRRRTRSSRKIDNLYQDTLSISKYLDSHSSERLRGSSHKEIVRHLDVFEAFLLELEAKATVDGGACQIHFDVCQAGEEEVSELIWRVFKRKGTQSFRTVTYLISIHAPLPLLKLTW